VSGHTTTYRAILGAKPYWSPTSRGFSFPFKTCKVVQLHRDVSLVLIKKNFLIYDAGIEKLLLVMNKN